MLEQFLTFLQKNPFNLMLFGTAVITAGMLIWPLINRPFRQGKEIGVAETVQLINRRDAVVIDLRDSGDYAAGHIANAKHIPDAQIAERMKDLEKYKSRPVIVSCSSGNRASRVVATLGKNGFSEVFALRGGIAAWQQSGMPLVK
jgi:rhodanese-related sulfurtransferase